MDKISGLRLLDFGYTRERVQNNLFQNRYDIFSNMIKTHNYMYAWLFNAHVILRQKNKLRRSIVKAWALHNRNPCKCKQLGERMLPQRSPQDLLILTDFNYRKKKRHTLRSSAVRFPVLTGAWGTELSRSLGGGSGSTGRLQHNSFKDAIVARDHNKHYKLPANCLF